MNDWIDILKNEFDPIQSLLAVGVPVSPISCARIEKDDNSLASQSAATSKQ